MSSRSVRRQVFTAWTRITSWAWKRGLSANARFTWNWRRAVTEWSNYALDARLKACGDGVPFDWSAACWHRHIQESAAKMIECPITGKKFAPCPPSGPLSPPSRHEADLYGNASSAAYRWPTWNWPASSAIIIPPNAW
jgi:hypothetical protein